MAWIFEAARDEAWRRRLVEAFERMASRTDIEVLGAVVGPHEIEPPCVPATGIYLRWVTRGKTLPQTGGELHWTAIEPASGASAECLVGDVLHPEEAALLRSLHIVENHPDAGDYQLVLGRPDGELFFHKRGATFPLALSFEQFVEAQIALVGLSGWLELFAELDAHGMPAGSLTADEAVLWKADHRRSCEAVLAVARAILPHAVPLLEQRVR